MLILKTSQTDFKDSGYIFPLAVAIVLSGQYEDDVDNSEEIVYTGQGGHDLLGNKRQIKDQVMKSGNLALKVCPSNYDLYSCNSFLLFHIYLLFVLLCNMEDTLALIGN